MKITQKNGPEERRITEIDIEAEIARKEAELVELEVAYKDLMNQKLDAGIVIKHTRAAIHGLQTLRTIVREKEMTDMEGKETEWFKDKQLVKANFCDYSYQRDLPTGWFIKRVLVVPEGNFSILGICLKFLAINERQLILDDTLPVYRPLVAPEVLVIPFILPHGLDMRHFTSGDVKLGFTIGDYSEGSILTLYYDCWKPKETTE